MGTAVLVPEGEDKKQYEVEPLFFFFFFFFSQRLAYLTLRLHELANPLNCVWASGSPRFSLCEASLGRRSLALGFGCFKGFAVCTSPFQYFAVEGIGVAGKCRPGPKRCPGVPL